MFWRKSGKSSSASPASASSAADTKISFDVVPAPFPPKNDNDRAALLQFIAEAPIAHGPWQGFKQLFKTIEAHSIAQPQAEPELLAAMLSRIDGLPLGLPVMRGQIGHDVLPGAPRATWDAAERRLTVRDASGQEGSLTFNGHGSMVQLGTWAVLVAGDYNNGRLHLVDVSDATQPTVALNQELKNVYAWNAVAFAARRGDHLFVCFRLSNPYNNIRLVIFDVSEKTPREIGSLRLGEAYQFQAALDGERLFFLGGGWNTTQVKVVDLREPARPKLGGSVNVGNVGWGNSLLTASNGLAYVAVAGRNPSVKIVDGRDPDKLSEKPKISVTGLTGVASHNGRIYVRIDPRELKDPKEKEERSRFRVIDDSNGDKPKLLGAPPSTRTLGYMKRRARRLLWKLAEKNPALYVDLVSRLIAANGPELNYAERWLSVDALLGAGRRWEQRRHGRAGYELKNPRFVWRKREERFAPVWDAHLAAAQRLWQSESVPLEAREMALKIMHASGQEIPVIDIKRLVEFLLSSSPLLQSYASRAAWQHIQSGGNLDGKTAALALLAAPAKLRAQFEDWAEKTKWSKEERRAFGLQLQCAVGASRPDGKDVPWRRRDYAARLLAGAWNEFLDQNALLENLPFWLRLNDEKLMARVLEVLRSAGKATGEELAAHLRTLSRHLAKIEESQRETLLEAFLSGAVGRSYKGNEALALVNQDDIAALGWRLLEKASLNDKALQFMWAALMEGLAISAGALRIAFTDPIALALFEKAPFDLPSLRGGRENAAAFFQHGGAAFIEILLRRLDAEHRPTIVLRALSLFKGEDVEQVWSKYAHLADDFVPLERDLQRARFFDYGTEPGPRAWDFLARSKAGSEFLRWMWRQLFRMAQWSEISGAFTNAAAPELLRRAEFPTGELDELIKNFPKVIERASPAFYIAILDVLPGDQRLQRLLETNAERWPAAREAVLQSLREPSGLVAFWAAVWEKMKAGDSVLKERLLDDEAVVATFENIEAQSFEPFLKTDDPTHEPWILRWFKAHKPEKGDELLLLAATHNLPGVRKWGLGRAEYLRLDLATALRLLEAELPDCVQAGRKFFESVPGGSDNEQDYALALCDSPGYAAREYGREFIEARRESLFEGDLLARLAQGSSPDMQAWLAEKLLENPAPAEATQTFDKAVLRARGRARQAKNLVQERHQKDGAKDGATKAKVETTTLLEIARSRTPRDADWALRQLAERALAGEKIEGVEIVQ
ncbi:MAG TPA: hypothetical protein VGB77_01860 [Abditibacteriaceae bacterium]